MNKTLSDLIELLIAVNVNTKHTVMFDYMGHTENFVIRFYENGWKASVDADQIYRFYLDEEEWEVKVNTLYEHFSDILNKDHKLGFDKECGF